MKTTLVILVAAFSIMAFSAVSTGAEDAQPPVGSPAGPSASASRGKVSPSDALNIFAVSRSSDQIRHDLERGASDDAINAPSSGGLTPLMTAAMNGNREAVALLVKHGADPNAKVLDATSYMILVNAKISSLHKQALEKNKGMIEVTRQHMTKDADMSIHIQLGANDREEIKGFTALHFACFAGEPEVVETLVAKGADIRAKTAKGQTPLILAAKFGHMDVVRALFQGELHPDEVTEKDDYGGSAWSYAFKAGKLYDLLRASGFTEEAARHIAENKFPQDSLNKPLFEKPESRKEIALIRAAADGRYVWELGTLMSKGANVNAKTNDGTTALMRAAQNGHVEVVRVLLEKDADVNARAEDGRTALLSAAQNGHTEAVRQLLEKDADVNAQDNNGDTALIRAAINRHVAVAKLLLEKNARVDVTDKQGWTALVWAASKGRPEVVKLLLGQGADLNSLPNKGGTALMRAAGSGHVEIVRLLLQKGADLHAKDSEGDTALTWAADKRDVDVAKLLLEKGAQVDARNKQGGTALMWAASKGGLDVMKLLLEKGADVNLQNDKGETALTIASRKKQPQIVELLKAHGAKEMVVGDRPGPLKANETKASDKAKSLRAAADASRKTYSEGIFRITLPSTYQKLTEGPALDDLKKNFTERLSSKAGRIEHLFFTFFSNSLTRGSFVCLCGLNFLRPLDFDQLYRTRVNSFQRNVESGAVLKTSRGISRVTIDGVSGALDDTETAQGSRSMVYTFVLPDDRSKMFFLVISGRTDAFKPNEAEVADIIKSLKISRVIAEKPRSAPAAEATAPKKSYSEGVFLITLPSGYQKVTEAPLLDPIKKMVTEQLSSVTKGKPPLFFTFFRKSFIDSLHILLVGVQLPGPVDFDQMRNNLLKSFDRDVASGKLLKTSRGVSKIKIDGVTGVLVDRESAQGSRSLNYNFVLPENRTRLFQMQVIDKISTFKANETEVADIIKTLKISRNVPEK